jgi:hypothetical protein
MKEPSRRPQLFTCKSAQSLNYLPLKKACERLEQENMDKVIRLLLKGFCFDSNIKNKPHSHSPMTPIFITTNNETLHNCMQTLPTPPAFPPPLSNF